MTCRLRAATGRRSPVRSRASLRFPLGRGSTPRPGRIVAGRAGCRPLATGEIETEVGRDERSERAGC